VAVLYLEEDLMHVCVCVCVCVCVKERENEEKERDRQRMNASSCTHVQEAGKLVASSRPSA
jgi:hypothetical protein